MKIVMSDNAPGPPTITHHGLQTVQICAPPDWTSEQIEDFANATWKPADNYRWTITSEPNALFNTPHPCDFEQTLIHHNLQLQPASSPTNTPYKKSHRQPPEMRARVIINLDGATPESILATAHSFDLLAEYLRMKAHSIDDTETPLNNSNSSTTEAEHLQNQILAQFPGTIIFI